jgi:hypothetical protein
LSHTPPPSASAAAPAQTPAQSVGPPEPSPTPDPPKLHNPTEAEIAQAKADDLNGIVHGSEERPGTDKKMSDMLPEHPTIKGGYAQLGNLRVQADKYAEFREAMMYEAQNPGTAGIIDRLEKGPNKTTVAMNETADNQMIPHASGGAEVHWDPKHMHIASNDAHRSPATRLAHELDHADEWTHDPQRLLLNANVHDPKYGNLEEKRVITGSERRNVKVLGEGQRDDHGHGKGDFEARGVTSAEPVLHQTRDGNTTEIREGYSQSGKISIEGDVVRQEVGRGQSVSYKRSELEGMVGEEALAKAAASGKPFNVAVTGGEFAIKEPRSQAQEVQNVR